MSFDRVLAPVVDWIWEAIVQMRNETPLWSIRESLRDRASNEVSLSQGSCKCYDRCASVVAWGCRHQCIEELEAVSLSHVRGSSIGCIEQGERGDLGRGMGKH